MAAKHTGRTDQLQSCIKQIDASSETMESAREMMETQGAVISGLKKRCTELENALKGLSTMYTHAWNLVDGGLFMADYGLRRFEAAHKEARRVLGVELMDVDEDGNLTPEHSVMVPSEPSVTVPAKPTDVLLRPFYECPPDELESAWNAMVMMARATIEQRDISACVAQGAEMHICGECDAQFGADARLRQIGTSEEADFERGTWTFKLQPGFVVTAGEYMIVQRVKPAEGLQT